MQSCQKQEFRGSLFFDIEGGGTEGEAKKRILSRLHAQLEADAGLNLVSLRSGPEPNQEVDA